MNVTDNPVRGEKHGFTKRLDRELGFIALFCCSLVRRSGSRRGNAAGRTTDLFHGWQFTNRQGGMEQVPASRLATVASESGQVAQEHSCHQDAALDVW